jgi:hypothetical protein
MSGATSTAAKMSQSDESSNGPAAILAWAAGFGCRQARDSRTSPSPCRGAAYEWNLEGPSPAHWSAKEIMPFAGASYNIPDGLGRAMSRTRAEPAMVSRETASHYAVFGLRSAYSPPGSPVDILLNTW